MTIYGLWGFTHGWAKVLTLMSPEGSSRLLEQLGRPEGVEIVAGDGSLPRLLEKGGGALARIVAEHGVIVLERPDWERRKAEFGPSAYR